MGSYVPPLQGLAPGLVGLYFANWTAPTFPNVTSDVPTIGRFESGINHTQSEWSLPNGLGGNFAARYTGSLYVAAAGNYTFQLDTIQGAQLWVNNQLLIDQAGGHTKAGVGQGSYSVNEPGYIAIGVNYNTDLTAAQSRAVLSWKGANITDLTVIEAFTHPAGTFTACNATAAAAPAGTPVSGGAGIESLGGSTLSFLPQGNVTFLATYSKLSPFNPVVQNVIYFTELAISNAAGVTVESTLITPALAANGQGIDLSTAVIFRDLDLAQQFQQQLNQQPQNIFGASPILRSFFPLTVSTSQLNVYAQPPSAPTPPPVVTSAPRPPVTIQEANSSGPIILLPEQQATSAPLGAPLAAPVASTPAEGPTLAVPLGPAYTAPAPLAYASLAAGSAPGVAQATAPAGAGPYGASSVPLPDIIPVAYGLAPVPAVDGVVPPRVAVPPVAYAPGRPITYVGGPFPVTFGKSAARYLPVYEVVAPVPGPAAQPGFDELAYFAPIAPGPNAYSARPTINFPAPPVPAAYGVAAPAPYYGATAPAPYYNAKAPVPYHGATAPAAYGAVAAPYAGGLARPIAAYAQAPEPGFAGLYTPAYPIVGSYGAAQGPVPVYGVPAPSVVMPAAVPATAPELSQLATVAKAYASAPGPSTYFRSGLVQPYVPGSVGAPAPIPAPPSPPPAPPSPPPVPACSCAAVDKSIPATVKIQVLSTAYNSTTSEAILFDSYFTFSHPTAGLSPSQVRVFSTQTDPNTGAPMNTEGSITSVQQVSPNCALYNVKGFVNQSEPFVNNETVIFVAAGGNIVDACGAPFNTSVVQVSQPHRLEGQIAQRDVLYSSSEGAITQGNVADIAVVFTLPVPELDEAMFSVSGPATYNLTDFSVLSPDFTSFSFSVEVPTDFFGKATVFFNEYGADYLVEGRPAAVVPQPLTFQKATLEEQPILGRRHL
eukprot:jgi/Astpho2/7135/Aster-08314